MLTIKREFMPTESTISLYIKPYQWYVFDYSLSVEN